MIVLTARLLFVPTQLIYPYCRLKMGNRIASLCGTGVIPPDWVIQKICDRAFAVCETSEKDRAG